MKSRWAKIVVAVGVLVVAQVLWWTTSLMTNVSVIYSLKQENLALSSAPGHKIETSEVEALRSEAFHRRVMFLSESIFFVCVMCLGMYLLYRSLKAEERSRERQRNFIEIVSHESKTPLTALKLRLESMTETHRRDDQLSRELSLALAEVRRLSSLFDKALSLHRLERDAFRFEPLYVADSVREVVHRLEPFFRDRKVALSLELDEEAMILGDAHGFQNSLQSLLENAVLYNDKAEKAVQLRVTAANSRVKVAVVDNGPGIRSEDHAHLFDRFYRRTQSTRIPGSGLGLYLAKTIVEAHQGVIHLISSGTGSTFEIDLPLGAET